MSQYININWLTQRVKPAISATVTVARMTREQRRLTRQAIPDLGPGVTLSLGLTMCPITLFITRYMGMCMNPSFFNYLFWLSNKEKLKVYKDNRVSVSANQSPFSWKCQVSRTIEQTCAVIWEPNGNILTYKSIEINNQTDLNLTLHAQKSAFKAKPRRKWMPDAVTASQLTFSGLSTSDPETFGNPVSVKLRLISVKF